MPARIALVTLVVAVLAWPAAAAGDSGGDFSIQGIADPQRIATLPTADLPGRLEKMIRQQAMTDAVCQMAVYTQGVGFRFDFSNPDRPVQEFDDPRSQPASGVLPKTKTYQALESGLVMITITYDEKDLKRLNVREGLLELPIYSVDGTIHEPRVALSRPKLHWYTMRQCYMNAVMAHVTRTHGNRILSSVSGRVFPVAILEAKMELVPKNQEQPAETPPADKAAPAPTEKGDAPPAAQTPPSSPTGATGDEPSTPETGDAKPAAPKDADADGQAKPAAGADGAASADEAKDDAEDQPKPLDTREYKYFIRMTVRVQIDDIKFAVEAPTKPAEDAVPPKTDAAP